MRPKIQDVSHEKYSLETALQSNKYTLHQSIGTALQGSVYRSSKDNTIFVIKIIDKSLYRRKTTHHILTSNHAVIQEDIVKEAQILKYLSNNDPPLSLTKYIDFFEDDYNYFLVMENGGDSLFSFVKQCHEFIQKGFLDLNVWRSFVRTAMLQIVSLIDWMHNTMNCCHLDISLENFVIQNVHISMIENTKKISKFTNFRVNIVDFGVAEVFSDRTNDGEIDFKCNKYVGKTQYQSPEICTRRDRFDARNADVWSFAVCFFMMSIGSPPFMRASVDDPLYDAIVVNGNMDNVLRVWNRREYVTSDILDLMSRLFVDEENRLNIKAIKKHRYFVC